MNDARRIVLSECTLGDVEAQLRESPKVIVPVGLDPPDKVAVSFTVVDPAAPVPVVSGAVVMPGEAWPPTAM